MRCKITKKRIFPFMSFGKMPIANGFIKKKDFNKEFFFKMEVGFNEELSLFQLNDNPKP
jgi:methylation protein EvaC